MSQKKNLELTVEQLRWQCDSAWLDSEEPRVTATTTDMIGQQTARDALAFGILSAQGGTHRSMLWELSQLVTLN